MRCPKCDEGSLIKIKFKASGRMGSLCDFCEALWFDHELVSSTTGHTYSSEDKKTFEQLHKHDQDHRPVERTRRL